MYYALFRVVNWISSRADDTARTIVDALKPTSTKPPINCQIINWGVDQPASVTRHVQLSDRLQMLHSNTLRPVQEQ